MSSLKKKENIYSAVTLLLFLSFNVRMGDECVPGDEESGVVMRGMAVILDILALLPRAKVVECCGSVKAHRGSFLFRVKNKHKLPNRHLHRD